MPLSLPRSNCISPPFPLSYEKCGLWGPCREPAGYCREIPLTWISLLVGKPKSFSMPGRLARLSDSEIYVVPLFFVVGRSKSKKIVWKRKRVLERRERAKENNNPRADSASKDPRRENDSFIPSPTSSTSLDYEGRDSTTASDGSHNWPWA